MSFWVKWDGRICSTICVTGLKTRVAGIVFQEADKDKGDFAIVIIYVNYNVHQVHSWSLKKKETQV